jgi:large subunit ribosomal protein L29
MMKVKDIRELSDEEIIGKIDDARKEIVKLRFELASSKLRNTASISNAKKRLARLLTIKNERELGFTR